MQALLWRTSKARKSRLAEPGGLQELTHLLDNGLRELARAGNRIRSGVTDRLPFLNDIKESSAHFCSFVLHFEIVEHVDRRKHQGRRIGFILAGNVRSSAVHRFEDGTIVADVCARRKAEPTDGRRREVSKQVAEKIRKQHDAEPFGA